VTSGGLENSAIFFLPPTPGTRRTPVPFLSVQRPLAGPHTLEPYITTPMGLVIRCDPVRRSNRNSKFHPLLVHCCLDPLGRHRIDENPSSANKSGRDALRHHTLEIPVQRVAFTKAFVPCDCGRAIPMNAVTRSDRSPFLMKATGVHYAIMIWVRAEDDALSNWLPEPG
jgi:hypothetical protein